MKKVEPLEDRIWDAAIRHRDPELERCGHEVELLKSEILDMRMMLRKARVDTWMTVAVLVIIVVCGMTGWH